MPIPFICPHCQSETLVDDEFAGLSGPCFSCQKTVLIPSPTQAGIDAPKLKKRFSWFGLYFALILGAALLGGIAFVSIGLLLSSKGNNAVGNLAQRTKCGSHLKKIHNALELYRDQHGSYPPAFTTDAKGTPLLSWRVLILPQLGHPDLYDRFNHEEAWDGPMNNWLVQQPPEVYACPSAFNAFPGETHYLGIVDSGTLFARDAARYEEITDGPEQTIAVAEVRGMNIAWTEPNDLDFTQLQRSGEKGLMSDHPDGSHLLMADGTVLFLSDSVATDYLHAMATINGGEDVPIEVLVGQN